MPEEKDITYKNLFFKFHPTHRYLEILIDDKNFSDVKGYITSISIVLEFVLTIRPKFVIANKLETDFRLGEELFPFTRNQIFAPMKAEGVNKFICVMRPDHYDDRFRNIEANIPFVQGFTSKADALQWIAENS
jgi:hypothetical protein